MPRRSDLNHVLVIGSGPIVIGQACEFDYSGTQACQVLRSEGIQVSLVNSNPASIMTDPEYADYTYIEPINCEYLEKIINQHIYHGNKIDAILATMGGQTALNAATELHSRGVLKKYDIELIGADFTAIQRGEDRQTFKDIVAKIGGESARSQICSSMSEVRNAINNLGVPIVIRPNFTMGGFGSGMAYSFNDIERIAKEGLSASPYARILIEESIYGWKEFELELMRDNKDNIVVVCSIENIDPIGVHTGDSITVAPAMTLTDHEYQKMRDLGIAIIREVGVNTGGCNIQFAVNPNNGRLVVVEMNPRVSRSSALASKATGFPIAKIATKLALGYYLDEIINDITKETPACFEPALDYIVVKAPRFAFEKFPNANATLTTNMKSVGEAMSLGRNFLEALGKVMRSLETKKTGFWTIPDQEITLDQLFIKLRTPTDDRLYDIEYAIRLGVNVKQISQVSGIDLWFIEQISNLVALRYKIIEASILDSELLRLAKYSGLSDRQIAILRPEIAGECGVYRLRCKLNVHPVYKTIDTCAAEFESKAPYYYSSYELDPATETEVIFQTEKPKVIILGSGPNRIGQGIEFDYSCVHAALTLSKAGFETIIVNCNPETVSTDYDTADRLYFEPLTFEDVIEVFLAENNSGKNTNNNKNYIVGVIIQLGGQTPLKLARSLEMNGLPIVGTNSDSINIAENRSLFGKVLVDANLPTPKFDTAKNFEQIRQVALKIGYPILVRPSYVLGGYGMEILYNKDSLESYINRSISFSSGHPILVDKFLEGAVEIDVDALCDGSEVYIGGIMEHIEEAGIHSGDSACVLPSVTLGRRDLNKVRQATEAIAHSVGVIGLLNIQYALKNNILYVLEANPRASRTVPFVSKATAIPLAKACARIILGSSIVDLRNEGVLNKNGDTVSCFSCTPIAIKEAVLPFNRFYCNDGTQVDSLLGPEMKSTGEVMGIAHNFGVAFAKSQAAAYGQLPTTGTVFVSVADSDKNALIFLVKRLTDLGFYILATKGTADILKRNNVSCSKVRKHSEKLISGGRLLSAVDLIKFGKVDMIINTPYGNFKPRVDGYEIRSAAISMQIPCVTTIQGASAAVQGIEAIVYKNINVISLQDLHSNLELH